jgi:hypothetical protein
MRDLGGQLNIHSCQPGTLISVTMPLTERAEEIGASAAD